MKITDGLYTTTIDKKNWALATDLLHKYGFNVGYISKYSDYDCPIEVWSVKEILDDLAQWGIKWKY